jgi:hypothetical protein
VADAPAAERSIAIKSTRCSRVPVPMLKARCHRLHSSVSDTISCWDVALTTKAEK